LQAESSGKPLRRLVKRRQKAVPRAEERTATTRRTSRGSTGRKRRKKILFQRLRKKEEESYFDLEKRTKFMISPQHSMGDGYPRRKCDNCGDGKSTRDADEGVLATLCTGCETRKGLFALEQKHSNSGE
jgi:formylmethanofuran dehydrogenase subunit E